MHKWSYKQPNWRVGPRRAANYQGVVFWGIWVSLTFPVRRPSKTKYLYVRTRIHVLVHAVICICILISILIWLHMWCYMRSCTYTHTHTYMYSQVCCYVRIAGVSCCYCCMLPLPLMKVIPVLVGRAGMTSQPDIVVLYKNYSLNNERDWETGWRWGKMNSETQQP